MLKQIFVDLRRLSPLRPATFTKFLHAVQRERKRIDRKLADLGRREGRKPVGSSIAIVPRAGKKRVLKSCR